MIRKGIILAGGAGTRLHPATMAINKHLQMVYDKPMLYYPLSVLLLAGVKEILIISTPETLPLIKTLFPNNARSLGINIEFAIQEKPDGIAQAFILAEDFLNGSPSILILGDNIFYGMGFRDLLKRTDNNLGNNGAMIFTYQVQDPSRYGILVFNRQGEIVDLIEKPQITDSNQAITGIYFYDSNVTQMVKKLKPSKRGELEITDLNKAYLAQRNLQFCQLGRGMAWLDTGTTDSLLDAANYIAAIERRQGLKIACLEEIVWRNGWISDDAFYKLGKSLEKSNYGQYIINLSKQKHSNYARNINYIHEVV